MDYVIYITLKLFNFILVNLSFLFLFRWAHQSIKVTMDYLPQILKINETVQVKAVNSIQRLYQ